jgi:formylglycine-generating enzyme required for sulfatase activity
VAGEPTRTAAAWVPPPSFDEYEIIRPLGGGAAGRVFLAHDTLLDRAVAIKFLVAPLDADMLARFLVEARAAARIQHPNVATLYRVGQLARRPYLVSEYVRGRSLEQHPKPVAWDEALRLALAIARGLAAAHRSGVLHRDVSPKNVVVSETGEVKLVDFGLAQIGDRPQADAAGDGPRHLVGTPVYAAPELWRGEPASRRADVYAFGALVHELCAGRPPHGDVAPWDRPTVLQQREVPSLGALVPGIDPHLRDAVDRCLRRDPAERFASAEDLRDALELIVEPTLEIDVPAGNPYRGLRAFEADHRGLFFGRRAEIRAVSERLRSSALVVVAGDSGVGKSSLCAAGVVPAVTEGALRDGRTWTAIKVVPGRQPIEETAAALARSLDLDAEELRAALRSEPLELARVLRRRVGAGAGVLLYLDQSEELVTVSARTDAEALATALAAVAAAGPGLKVLATARSDFLTRLSVLPGLGAELSLGLYLLAPLSRDGIRQAVVGPATVKGVRFESDALVEEIVGSASAAEGGLPLLQFALAELWEERDVRSATITAAALRALGGVEGALVRHADGVLARLGADARLAARRVLMRLVTLDGTRARRTELELVQDVAERTALDALVAGRLVVASEAEHGAVFELAHEALVRGWATLAGWLADSAEQRALEQRLAQSAAEWERLGRARDALWGARQLEEVRSVDAARLREPERAFLATSRRAAGRRQRARIAAAAAVPVAALILWASLAVAQRARTERIVGAALGEAEVHFAALADARAALRGQRRASYAAFDAGDASTGEARWAEALATAPRVAAQEAAATHALEKALLADPRRPEARAKLAAVLSDDAAEAERDGRLDARDDALRRMALYDDGRLRERWTQPTRVAVVSAPPGEVEVLRYVARGDELRAEPTGFGGRTPLDLALEPGSYLLVLRAPQRPEVRHPVLVRRDEPVRATVPLPRPADLPEGFVVVPEGEFLLGSGDPEPLRREFLKTVPVHPVRNGPFLIAREEVTYAEWLVFLRDLPPAERALRTPRVDSKLRGGLGLTPERDGRYRLSFQPTVRRYSAVEGEPIRYAQRDRRAVQDWRRFPVTGISWADALAFTRWLDRTGRVPGARPCREDEWEHAARGADGRDYPGGVRLGPDDANIDLTYGKDPLALGPDEVGSHPASASPYGVLDLAGNAFEWTEGALGGAARPVLRGGSFYYSTSTARATNREAVEPTLRDLMLGLRVCASIRAAR